LDGHAQAVGSMLDLNDFFYFVQIVERGGFTAAGFWAASTAY
jgi:hypothetical protein